MDARSQKTVQLMFEWAELVGRRMAKVSRKPHVKYFVASDSSMAIYMAYARFGKDNVLVTPGKLQVCRRPSHQRCSLLVCLWLAPRSLRYVLVVTQRQYEEIDGRPPSSAFSA